MNYLIISVTALVVSSLTLFSGFGLGTILMPAFALFFPIPVAVAATAVVHLANNIFKLVLVGRHADRGVVVRFALPAALAAIAGAALLNWIARVPAIASYYLGAQLREVTVIKIIIGVLIILFALLDLIPKFQKMSFNRKYLPLGGLLSGFFGGLSGNQGALRSAFLIKSGLDTTAFVGTGSVCAFIVDVVRLVVYSLSFYTASFLLLNKEVGGLVIAAILFAFLGSFVGARLMKKVTISTIQYIVGVMLIAVGIGLGTGLI